MNSRLWRPSPLAPVLTVLALALLTAPGLEAQEGVVQGRVVDGGTLEPVSGAEVVVTDQGLGELTGPDGRFRITGVAPGDHTVRVRRIGFQDAQRSVTVEAGGTVTLEVEIRTSAVTLDDLVVTTTGEQRQREIANAVSTIQVGEVVDRGTASDFTDVISGRSAGVQVQPSSGVSGSGSKVRVRGSSSVSLSNAPLVYVDGVRVSSRENAFTIQLGGQSFSRLDDLSPQNIASIEVVKGPSAGTLYGTEAANGVIRVTTKSGRGEPRLNLWTQGGTLSDQNDYPAIWQAVDADGDPCPLVDFADGLCAQEEVRSFNLLENDQTSPFSTGSRFVLGGSYAGSGEETRYYLSGEFANEVGTLPINEVRTINSQANFGIDPADRLSVDVSTSFVDRAVEAPNNDNSSLGFMAQALLGSSPTPDGWWRFSPAQLRTMESLHDVQRITGSTSVTWSPWDWLEGRLSGGIDYARQQDVQFVPVGQIPRGRDELGFRQENSLRTTNWTAELNLTANFDLTDAVTSETSVGSQYFEDRLNGVLARGEVLVPGTNSLSGAAVTEAEGVFERSKTIGFYVQERLGFEDRIFVTGGLRVDDNSTFGDELSLVAYPKIGGTWVLSEEGFFPDGGAVQSLRLRAAWGQSGTQPGVRDALTFLTGVAATTPEGTDEIGVTFEGGGLGNPQLKPERSSEIEAGLDAELFERLNMSLTYFRKTTEDALVFRDVAPSVGAAPGRFENLGGTKNEGVEGDLSTHLPVSEDVAVDLSLVGSLNKNVLQELGEGISPLAVEGDIRQVEGYPLTGYWARDIESWEDSDGDGIISPSEVAVTDTAVFIGPSDPEVEVSFQPTVTVFERVSLSGLLNYRGGHHLQNGTASFRCGRANTRSRNDPDASLFEQARCVASSLLSADGGYFEEADHLRFQELSLRMTAPDAWAAGLFGASSAELVLSARNLAMWTDYTGVDPSVNRFGTQNFGRMEFLTVGPPRRLTARLNLSW